MSTSGARKHSYHHGDLHASLLRAAGYILEKEGVGSLSVRGAARRAGVSHSAPYRHYPEREALLAAVAAEGFERLGKLLAEAGVRGPWERGEAYVRFALDNPQRFRLMFGGGLRLADHPALRAHATRAHDDLLKSFALVSSAHGAQIAAAAAWSLVHGLASLLLDGHFPQATREGREREGFVRNVLASIRFAARAPIA